MDLATLLGIVFAFAALVGAFVIEGGHPVALLGLTAFMIVVGGTLGAATVGHALEDMLRLPALVLRAFKSPPDRRRTLVQEIVALAELARRDGLLALENREITDPFLKRATMLVVDGTDPDVVREILESDVDAMAERHAHSYGIFTTMGGYAPTMGILGTVMGLVHVLSNLSEPDALGPAVAVAFLATLYGVATANLLWLPLAGKLKLQSQREIAEKTLVVEGIISLQAGDNPRVLRERLLAVLPPKAREAPETEERSAAGAPVAEATASGGE